MNYKGLGNGYRLILELHEAGGRLQGGQLRSAIKNYDTAKNIAYELRSMGLVRIEIVQKPKSVHWYILTDKGLEVAEKLAEVERIIGRD